MVLLRSLYLDATLRVGGSEDKEEEEDEKGCHYSMIGDQ